MKIITYKNINVDSILGIKSFTGKIVVADLDNAFFNNNYFNKVTTFFNCQTELIKIIKDNLNN